MPDTPPVAPVAGDKRRRGGTEIVESTGADPTGDVRREKRKQPSPNGPLRPHQELRAQVQRGAIGDGIATLDKIVAEAYAAEPITRRTHELSTVTTSMVSGLLYAASALPTVPDSDVREAVTVYRRIYRFVLDPPGAPPPPHVPFDERVGTLGLRLMQRAGATRNDLLAALNSMFEYLSVSSSSSSGSDGSGSGGVASPSPATVPAKRRLFSPLLDACVDQQDHVLALDVLCQAASRGVQLRDDDYKRCLLASGVVPSSSSSAPTTAARPAWRHRHAVATMRIAATSQPLVGGDVADLLRQSLRPTPPADTPPAASSGTSQLRNPPAHTGRCAACGGSFSPIVFRGEERSAMLRQLTECLVAPHCAARAAQHPQDPSAQNALSNFHRMCGDIEARSVSFVVDGANVGFYGLSSWYADAKREAIRARGEDPATYPSSAFDASMLKKDGVPTDISPNFALIDEAVQEVERQIPSFFEEGGWGGRGTGGAPLVILHERHLKRLTPANKGVVERWAGRGVHLIASPNHVNDDMCWMWAALRHQCPVLSNDQMRDHHFRLFAPRRFLQWRTTAQIFFSGFGVGAVRLRRPPRASTWVTVATTAAEAEREGVPVGMVHVPFTNKRLQEDTGKLLPGTKLPPNTLLVPQSAGEAVFAAAGWCDGWLCAPIEVSDP